MTDTPRNAPPAAETMVDNFGRRITTRAICRCGRRFRPYDIDVDPAAGVVRMVCAACHVEDFRIEAPAVAHDEN